MDTILEQGGSLGVLLIFALLLFREAAMFVRGKKNGGYGVCLSPDTSRLFERVGTQVNDMKIVCDQRRGERESLQRAIEQLAIASTQQTELLRGLTQGIRDLHRDIRK